MPRHLKITSIHPKTGREAVVFDEDRFMTSDIPIQRGEKVTIDWAVPFGTSLAVYLHSTESGRVYYDVKYGGPENESFVTKAWNTGDGYYYVEIPNFPADQMEEPVLRIDGLDAPLERRWSEEGRG